MAKQFLSFLREGNNAKAILFYTIVSIVVGVIFFGSTKSPVVEIGWGYGFSKPPAPPLVINPTGTNVVHVVINSGAPTTDSTKVDLLLPEILKGDQMAISNDEHFTGAIWEPYRREVHNWLLHPEPGEKIVFAKFRSSRNGGVTPTYKGYIQLTEAATGRDTSGKSTATPVSCQLQTNTAYKTANSPAVFYITSNCTKQPFRNPDVFFTYFTSWNDVRVTASSTLNGVTSDPIRFVPYGPRWRPGAPAVVKTTNDASVYLLTSNRRYPFGSPAVFASLGYDWVWVEDVSESFLRGYQAAHVITNPKRHLDGSLIRYPDASTIYLLENGQQRAFKSLEQVKSQGYRSDRVVVVPDGVTYPDGPAMP